MYLLATGALLVACSGVRAQGPEIKFIADTLVVQADGTYEADPDVATSLDSQPQGTIFPNCNQSQEISDPSPAGRRRCGIG
jgi:hypothetical protein